jgi:hypothetical protein
MDQKDQILSAKQQKIQILEELDFKQQELDDKLQETQYLKL